MYLTEEEKKKLRAVQIELLKEFRRICDKHGLKYWLDSGTLLGAVRHKGFIPWDDDIDVALLRPDYDKFVKIAQDELDSNKYYLQNWLSDSKYGQPFSKIRKNNTVYIEQYSENVNFNSGIYMDVFAYDEYGGKMLTQGMPIKVLRRMILSKSGYRFWIKDGKYSIGKYLIYVPLRILAAFFKAEQLKEEYESIARKYNGTERSMVFENGTTDYNHWAIERSCFDSTVDLEFEGELYKCPVGYDKYLKTVYGDYMKLPPLEKRLKKHPVVRLEF